MKVKIIAILTIRDEKVHKKCLDFSFDSQMHLPRNSFELQIAQDSRFQRPTRDACVFYFEFHLLDRKIAERDNYM